MNKFGKWIGAGLGWAFAGPIGAVIGLALGWMFDNAQQVDLKKGYSRTTTGDFALSMLVLIAAVMKADGKVLRSELDYVKAFLIQKFGRPAAQEALRMLRDLIKQNIPIEDVTYQIRDHLEYSSRLELMHLLYGIATADRPIQTAEMHLLERIGYYLGLSSNDQSSLKNMFAGNFDHAYKILGVDRNQSFEEIRKVYRSLAIKNHPDKVSHLGDDIRKDAEIKFQKINAAYDAIKKERGIK